MLVRSTLKPVNASVRVELEPPAGGLAGPAGVPDVVLIAGAQEPEAVELVVAFEQPEAVEPPEAVASPEAVEWSVA